MQSHMDGRFRGDGPRFFGIVPRLSLDQSYDPRRSPVDEGSGNRGLLDRTGARLGIDRARRLSGAAEGPGPSPIPSRSSVPAHPSWRRPDEIALEDPSLTLEG